MYLSNQFVEAALFIVLLHVLYMLYCQLQFFKTDKFLNLIFFFVSNFSQIQYCSLKMLIVNFFFFIKIYFFLNILNSSKTIRHKRHNRPHRDVSQCQNGFFLFFRTQTCNEIFHYFVYFLNRKRKVWKNSVPDSFGGEFHSGCNRPLFAYYLH